MAHVHLSHTGMQQDTIFFLLIFFFTCNCLRALVTQSKIYLLNPPIMTVIKRFNFFSDGHFNAPQRCIPHCRAINVIKAYEML